MNCARRVSITIVLFALVLPAGAGAAEKADGIEQFYLDPLQLVADFRSAMGQYLSGDYSSAERAFLILLQQDPENASFYIFMADSQRAQGRNQTANGNYEKAYQILKNKYEQRREMLPDVKQSEIYSDMAYCLNAMQRFDEARKKAMDGMPERESANLYINLAYAFHKLDQTEKARTNYCNSKEISEPKELNNLTYRRLSNLFENGQEWINCPDEVVVTAEGTYYALIIAVEKYRDPKISPLKYAQKDALKLYQVLTNPGTGLFKPKNITMLTNEKATGKNIKFKLDDMVRKAKHEEDLLLVFYAGHGFTYPNKPDTYWLTYDTEIGDSEGNRIKWTAFSNSELAKILADISANKFVFFIDACFSAGMVNQQSAVRGLENYIGRPTGKDYVIITSSQADQLSYSDSNLKHGLFSYFLAKGLSGEADKNVDGVVDIDELWPFINTGVSNYAVLLEKEQTPRRSGSWSRKIFVSKNPNY
jgi:tetratricopeptide (TPR) repeat protein